MRPIEDHGRLERLDPAVVDPAYWERFQARVMQRARPALAQRRREAMVTVGQVLHSWSRAVVPMAMAATLMAALFLLDQAPTPSQAPSASALGESGVLTEAEAGPVPDFLSSGEVISRDRALTLVEGG